MPKPAQSPHPHGLVCILIFLCLAISAAADYVPGELLVKYKRGSARIASVPALAVQEIPAIGYQRLLLPTDLSVEDAVAALKRDPNVEYAGPNHKVYLTLMPDDYYFDFQWGLYSGIGHDIHMPPAWDVTTGSPSVVVAMVDTGVYPYHEDFWENLIPGHNAVSGGNPQDTWDNNGHGTFTTGIVAAQLNNGIGIAGIAPGCRFMPIKVIEGETGSEADAAAGIVWAVDHGAKVLNCSIGTYDDVPALHAAVDYAWAHGCVTVAASGNDNLYTTSHYPSAYDSVLAVGATDHQDQRAVWRDPWFGTILGGSNWGPWLDVMAPGSSIFSTYNVDDGFLFGYYTIADGTSAAAPFVTGIAALLLSQHPYWTNQQVVRQIQFTADDIGASGWDQQTGWGRANAHRALTQPMVEVTRIGELSASPDGTLATVRGAVVTATPAQIPGAMYIQDRDRSAGIMVNMTGPSTPAVEGDIVDVTGILGQVSGERAILTPVISVTGHTAAPIPLGIANRYVGGGDRGYTPGVYGSRHMNNVGLLVRVWGRVTMKTFSYFYIDDGSHLDDDSGNTGLRIEWGGPNKPSAGKYVFVTGISGCEIPQGANFRIREIRVRKNTDIVVAQ